MQAQGDYVVIVNNTFKDSTIGSGISLTSANAPLVKETAFINITGTSNRWTNNCFFRFFECLRECWKFRQCSSERCEVHRLQVHGLARSPGHRWNWCWAEKYYDSRFSSLVESCLSGHRCYNPKPQRCTGAQPDRARCLPRELEGHQNRCPAKAWAKVS